MPAAVRPMMLFTTVLPVASAPVMFTPLPAFDEITLPSLDDGAADLVIGRVVDPDAVAEVARLAVAEDITAAGCRADIVGLDQVSRRAHALDVDAVSRRWPR